jgi:hypothetical protein
LAVSAFLLHWLGGILDPSFELPKETGGVRWSPGLLTYLVTTSVYVFTRSWLFEGVKNSALVRSLPVFAAIATLVAEVFGMLKLFSLFNRRK